MRAPAVRPVVRGVMRPVVAPVSGHLGPRVSALLDGQLSSAEEERAWDHVHSCQVCHDELEREGWVKTRLATMQYAGSGAPSHLKGSLLFAGIADWADDPFGDALVGAGHAARSRRHLGLSGIGGGAVGAAVMGVLALGASPANAPGAALNQPGGESFGSALTSAITSIIDPDRQSHSARGGSGPEDSQPLVRALGHTLAP